MQPQRNTQQYSLWFLSILQQPSKMCVDKHWLELFSVPPSVKNWHQGHTISVLIVSVFCSFRWPHVAYLIPPYMNRSTPPKTLWKKCRRALYADTGFCPPKICNSCGCNCCYCAQCIWFGEVIFSPICVFFGLLVNIYECDSTCFYIPYTKEKKNHTSTPQQTVARHARCLVGKLLLDRTVLIQPLKRRYFS